MKYMSKIKNYILDMYREVRYKVSWPAYSKVRNSAVLVLVLSLLFALCVGLMDAVLMKILVWFYNIF